MAVCRHQRWGWAVVDHAVHAPTGELVLPAAKRSLGAKDWGTMIEGHGGVLDRMDSVSFAA